MVQEVQQQWNRYQAPHEIESIWLSKRKVRKHTQVSPFFTYWCIAHASVTINFWPYETVEKKGTFNSISSPYWIPTFRKVDWWLRIPLAWAYEVEFSAKWWVSAAPRTHTIMVGKTKILQKTTTSSSWATSTTKINLWRWNILEYYGKVVDSSGGGATRTWEVNLTFRKL